MSEEEAIMMKDITEEVIEKTIMEEEEEFGEFEEELKEEEELYEPTPRRLMSEEEFFDRVDEFEERNHGLTLLIDRSLSLLARYARKYEVEMDMELWNEVARPSLNVGFWYYELVKGERLMLNYPQISLLIGAGALTFIAIGTILQIKEKRKEKKKEKPVKTEKEKIKEEVETKAKENKKEEKEMPIKNPEVLKTLEKNIGKS